MKLDRHTWAWPRVIAQIEPILQEEVPALASTLAVPIQVRARTTQGPFLIETKTFCFLDGQWFERYRGAVDVTAITEYLRGRDGQTDSWVDLYFAVDLAPADVADRMDAAAVAELLLHFKALRKRLQAAS